MDFKKAFDNVWRDGLYYKLLKAGVNCDNVKIIKSMYDKTQLCLKMNGNLSNPILAKKGVKQGCVLSSLLFNIFVNDIPSIFEKGICKPIKVGNILLSCLMYADDIVLLSESKEGIENCLTKLSEYTKTWMMEVNTTKSKVITFQKGGAIQKLNLKYDNNPLEQVKQFKYLGNIISHNGNFKENDKYLKNKGLRASFILLKKIGLTYKPSAYIRLFEKTVEPIILYNSEITRMPMSKKHTYEKFRSSLWNTEYNIDKVVNGFLKQILGVQKKTTTVGVYSECGKYPICMKIYVQIIKYWIRLLLTENELLQQTHLEEIHRLNDKKPNWLTNVKYLLEYTDMRKNLNINEIISQPNLFIKRFECKLKVLYQNHWRQKANQSTVSRLEFYFQYKKNFNFESYLDSLDRETRREVTRFRLSNHCLPIEKLRRENIDRKDRVCLICDKKYIGDEKHYLFHCNNDRIKQIRYVFLQKVKNILPEIEQLENENIIKYCMTMADSNLHLSTATFIKGIISSYQKEEESKINKDFCNIM